MSSLLEMVFTAPIVGVRKRWPNVLHAVTSDGLPFSTWPNGKATSACGLKGLRIAHQQDGHPIPWPPRVSTLPEGTTRCGDCYSAVGKTKVRSDFHAA